MGSRRSRCSGTSGETRVDPDEESAALLMIVRFQGALGGMTTTRREGHWRVSSGADEK